MSTRPYQLAYEQMLLARPRLTGRPVNMLALLQQHALTVDHRPLDADTVCLLLRDKRVVVINSLQVPGRQRFAMAHALGHWLMHSRMVQLCDAQTWYRDLDMEQTMIEEAEASAFAFELLAPAGEVMTLMRRGAGELAKHLELPLPLMHARLLHLGYMGPLDAPVEALR